MGQEFKTIMSYIEKMKSHYFFALSAFHVYETLNELLAPNTVGQETAEKNVVVINNYKNFFLPSKEALRVYFFLELAKLFDTVDDSLHITKLVNYTQSNLSKLKVEDFAKHDQNRELFDNLVKSYRCISWDDLKEVKAEIDKNKEIIEKLKTYRDQYLAHDDRIKDEVSITGEEVFTLFSVLKKILNLFSSKLDSSTTIYQNAEEYTKIDTKRVIDHLKRFEPYRLKEIKEHYQKELKKYKQ